MDDKYMRARPLHERGHVWETPMQGGWVWQVYCETRIVGPFAGWEKTEAEAWQALEAALAPKVTLCGRVLAWLVKF